MKTEKIFKILCPILVVALLLVSCTSTKFDGNAVLTGKVCDTEGRPVKNYHISAGIGISAITDMNGIFILRNMPSSSYILSGAGFGYISTELQVDFYDRKSIVCFQIERLEQLLPKIDELLSEEKISEAKKLLEKSKDFNEKNAVFISFRKLIDYCASPSEKKKNDFLETIEKI